MKPVILVLLLLVFPSASWAAENGSAASAGTVSRVFFLGDSITVGVGVQNRATERYSTVATRLLQARFPGCIEINLGRSGRALCQQDADYAAGILRQNPDAVVIQWGVNDHYWGYSVTQFSARYEQLVAALRTARPSMPIVATTLIADFRWPEDQDRWIAEVNVAIQEIAARYECHVADLHFALAHDRSFYADQIHPNAAGAAKMAEAIAAAFAAPPARPSVRFDHGREVRFMQNVFLPAWPDESPAWIRASDISAQGMRIETPAPLKVRTAPQYRAGAYQITVRDKAGAVVTSAPAEAKHAGFLQFELDPVGREGPFTVEIDLPSPAK
jgi:lysophospholipase L1-like esterase